MINQIKLAEWNVIYLANLKKAMAENPSKYMPGMVAETLAAKLSRSIENGTYNKDSATFKATVKHFGIKDTYTAINAWFRQP